MDPIVASGPLITTINDLVAVITYYGLASFVFQNKKNSCFQLLSFCIFKTTYM